MSNYAPSPSKKPIYQNLATKSLSEVSGTDIQTLTDPVKLAAINQDALIVNNIVNQAAMRDGNVMPDTGGIEEQIQTNDSVAITFRPPKGEVWKVMGISVYNSPNVTGTNSYYTYLSDPTQLALGNLPSGSRDVFYSSFASSSNLLGTENLFEEVFQPFFITNNMFIRMYSNMDNVGTSAEVQFRLAYMRIR